MDELNGISYEEFYRLSDDKILEFGIGSLMRHAKGEGYEKDSRYIKLRQIVSNFKTDSATIAPPKVESFRKRYFELREDENPERIIKDYPLLVSEFSQDL